jgi:peptidase S41-like protein
VAFYTQIREYHWPNAMNFALPERYLCLVLVCSSLTVRAQTSKAPSPALDSQGIKTTVKEVGETINREYFDANLAARMNLTLKQWLAEERYANVATPEALASKLTADLYSLSRDKHLSVVAVPSVVEGTYSGAGETQQTRAENVRISNAGVQRVEILPGNIGYLNITVFFRPNEAGEAIAGAMHMLRHADALILDSRDNMGGSVDTVALLTSYFFETPGLPLVDIVPRAGEALHYGTQTGIVDRDGKRPMYVLTSSHTWSGGEGIAYLLQERHRAEVIGETTVGAANVTKPYKINSPFYVNVPNSRIRSAVRGSNWEGTGVIPDIAVPAADALRVAQEHALRQLLSVTPDGSWHRQLEQELQKIGAEPVTQ